MPKCENKCIGPVAAETHTGLTKKSVICDIGTRVDIKHFVTVKNWLSYPAVIKLDARITSTPRLIHFEPHPDHTDVQVSDDGWEARCILPENQEYTFVVAVLSDRPNSKDQDIEVTLSIARLADSTASAVLPITVTA